MPKRSSIPSKGSGGREQSRKADRSTGASKQARPKNPAAVELGRLGGIKGGKARAAKLSPEERSEIARQAAIARWEARAE